MRIIPASEELRIAYATSFGAGQFATDFLRSLRQTRNACPGPKRAHLLKMMAKHRSQLNPVESPADEAMVFVCEKCGKHAECSGKDLRQELRGELKERGRKGAVRVVLTGCLDICPKNGVALGLARSGSPMEYLVGEGKACDVAQELLERLN